MRRIIENICGLARNSESCQSPIEICKSLNH
jgi:hypothetical protein